jgi:Tol biopolymer transport system component
VVGAFQEEVVAELERITSSKTFSSSPRLIEFLRFCVETSIKGDASQLKESTIGVSVFGRDPDYDPKIDPIVRVHARRLRKKLECFYESDVQVGGVVVAMPKGGYVPQFTRRDGEPLADILHIEEPAVPPQFVREPVESSRPEPRAARYFIRPRYLLLGSGVAALLCLTAYLAIRPGDRSHTLAAAYPVASGVVPGVLPLTALPGSERDPAWSPDGKKIAFAWDNGTDKLSRIYTMSVEGGGAAPLTNGLLPEFQPVWSADGQSVAFIRQIKASEYQVVLFNVRTRSEKVVWSQSFENIIPGQTPTLDWSSDGRWLVTNEQQDTYPARLVLISVLDGHVERITDPPNASTGDLEARFSPDGKQIAFRRGGMGDLWVLPVNGEQPSEARPLTRDNPGVRGLCWSADGKFIFFGGRRVSNLFSIWRIPAGENGGPPVQVSPAGLEAVSPALAPDGHHLAFVRPVVDVNIWRYDAEAPSHPSIFSVSTRMEYQPAYSRDGKQVAFISDRSGPAEVWVAGTDGSPARKITALNGTGLPMMPSWSPAGEKVVFFCRRNGLNYAIEVLVSGGPEKVLEGGAAYTLEPQYAADGKSIYYASNAGGRFRIWRKSLDGSSGPVEVTTEEAELFRLSQNGRILYFLRGTTPPQLVRKDLITGEQQTVWTWKKGLRVDYGWDVSGRFLYFVCQPNGKPDSQLIVANLDTQREGLLANLRTTGWATGLAASRDGKSVLVSQVDRDDTDIMYLNLNPTLAGRH